MANKKISELPYINGGKLSGNTLVPLVTYFSAATGNTVHTYISDIQNYLISGITGTTDVFVTGGTYSAGTITFTNNTGGTFNVTGVTFSGGSSVSGNYLPLSGGTVSGSTLFTNGLTADTISATTYLNLPANTDVFVTGGTYTSGTATFKNNTGGTFTVTGFTTGNTLQQVLVNGNTSNGNDIIMSEADNIIFKYAGFNNNINTEPLSSNRNILFQDKNGTVALLSDIQSFTGGTVSGSTLFTNGLTANTISATTYFNLPVNTDVFVTGGTYSSGTSTFTNNTGGTFNVTGFYTGDTTTLTGVTNVGTGLTIFDSIVDRSINLNSFTGDSLEKITTTLTNNTIEVGINETKLSLWPLVVNGNRLLDGSVSYVSGLTFDISRLNYVIDGSIYKTSSVSQVILDSGDTSFDRIDVIYADINGNTGVLKGTASTNPEKPIVDSNTQVEVTFVSVPTSASTPTINTELIYDEKVGLPTEWNFLRFGNQTFRISGDSTAQSYSGSKSISVSGLTTSGGNYSNGFILSSTTVTDTTQFATLQFAIRNMSGNSTNTYILIQFLGQTGNVLNGSNVWLYGGAPSGQNYSYLPTNTSLWQLISIPLWRFYLTSTNVYGIKFSYLVGSTVARHYIDKIELVEGLSTSPPTNNWVSIKGDSTTTISASAPNSTLTISGGTNISSSVSGTTTVVLNLDNNINLNGITATTISATTYQNLPNNVTGNYLPLSGGTVSGNTVITADLVVSGNSGVNWFSSNTSSDLVRITQTGTGNALVVEDSTNPDSSPFIINSGGSVSVGTTSVFSVGGGFETKLNVSTGSSGLATTGLSVSTPVIIESTIGSSIGLLNPDAANSQIYFGTPSDPFGSYLRWDYTNRNLILATANSTGKLIFQTANAVEAARIDQSGNMGINTTNPQAKLDIVGNFSALTTGTSVNWISANTSTDAFRITQVGSGNAFVVEDNTNPDTSPFVINTSGNTGIGTTTPQTMIELVSNNTTDVGNVLRFRNSDTVVPSLTEEFIGKIEFFSNETSGGGTGVKSYIGSIVDSAANSSIIFATTGGTGSLVGTSSTLVGERMRINQLGDVGIGTSSPITKLHVNGNSYVSGTLSATTLSGITTTISGTKGVTTINGSASTAFLTFSGSNTVGGTGYTDFIRVINTASGATNTNKSFRLDSLGSFEIINNNYNSALLTLTDSGDLIVTGRVKSSVNYSQTGGGASINLSASGSPQTILSTTITTYGNPVMVCAYGDAENSGAGYWSKLQLWRDSTAIGAIVHTEGSAGSENSPFAFTYIDAPVAGTYTYYLKANEISGGSIKFGESTAPILNVREL